MSEQQEGATGIKGLNRKSYDIPDCPVCLEELVSDLVCAPCGHVFHAMCLYQTLESNSACPCDRIRMTRSSVVSMRFNLKCNSEAEEQIQAFYNSLAAEEKQNVVSIINKYETQTREFARVKKHRDELVVTCREQVERLAVLDKSEKELQAGMKKVTLTKEHLAQRVHLEEMKRKELQALHEQDQIQMEDLKKNMAELRAISILKESLDKGGDYEDKFIEEIRRNKPTEEQARKYYEMLRIKKGMCDEIKRENNSLSSQFQEVKANYESLKRELRNRDIEQKNTNDVYQKKIASLKSKLELGKSQYKTLQLSLQSKGSKEDTPTQSIYDEENSNFSNLGLFPREKQQKQDSYANDPFGFNIPSSMMQQAAPLVLPLQSRLQQSRQQTENNVRAFAESNSRDKEVKNIFKENENLKLSSSLFSNNSRDSTDLFPSTKEQQNNQESRVIQADKLNKRAIEPTNITSFFQKKPKFDNEIIQKTMTGGGQGLFGISQNKNSLRNKNMIASNKQLSTTTSSIAEKKPSSISDFFKQNQ